MTNFPHIPDKEKKAAWFRLLKPLVKAIRFHPDSQNSKLLLALENNEGHGSWKTIKQSIEFALNHATNADSIFSRASQIRTDKDPEGVIDDMFAEVRTIPYLVFKGFKNIMYNRRDGLDFCAEFENQEYNIEATSIRGPSFKTQTLVSFNEATNASTHQLDPKKLINRLKTKCDDKEKQAKRHKNTPSNTIICVISNLEEMYEPWLAYSQFEGKHPIQNFVLSRSFPTVIIAPGTVYEHLSLNPEFDKLNKFDWAAFQKLLSAFD